MEFIGGDSSSDSDDEYVQNETKQVAPPDAPMMEVKTSTHVPLKSFSRPTGKKTDVNVKMKLKLLKEYEKRFGKITAPKSVESGQQEKIVKNKPVENEIVKKHVDTHNVANTTVETRVSQSATLTQQKLKPEWAEAFDAKTGKSYFYHLKSGITSWNTPGNYVPLTTSRKRRIDEVKVTNNQSKRARKTGSKIERSLLQGSSNNFDHLTSMATVAQSDILSAVDVDSSQMTSLTTTQEPRLRVQKWNSTTGQFVTSSGATKAGRDKNSIQALAAQAYVLQQSLDQNKKPGKSLKQSRLKYGW